MAASSGTQDPDVERWPIADALEKTPWEFEFFQTLRLLARMYPDRKVVGRFSNASDEVARFGVNPEVAFPASQIQSADWKQKPPLIRVNFMGLIGPQGALPLAYSDIVLDRLRARDTTMRDFFDIFNHRMISLFAQAFEKYRFSIAYERGERDRFSKDVLALIGLGSPGLQNRQEVDDDSLLFYSGLLAMHARSAEGLRQFLMDYFGVPVDVEQFVGAWYPVESDAQCALGEEAGFSDQLGFGAVVGDEIWDQQSRIRIQVGPLTLSQYNDFLPGREAWRRLRALTAFYVGEEFDVEAQLILKRNEVPACELKPAGEEGPQLGWTTWVKSAQFQRDPGETILDL
jgi:type VI secretion system protein ImpH